MNKMAGTFAGFGSFRLNGVRITEEEFGRGSYAVVLRLEYRGLKCAGKKLYRVLYEEGVGETLRRFEEECRLLAQMRHPNIVQFIGVYFEEGSHVPILVMEFLPTTLTRCIDTYGILPEEISYSILHDVALGLYHLHSHSPPIIHRDLSANNVLLASSMTAKISDLGVARILNLTPQQMSRMTQTPGTPAYMPPEAMRPNPMYDTRIDEFSYGILMIHVLSGRWPLPLCEAALVNPANRDQLLPVSEAERRDEYLQQIGNAHPLMGLILRCVSNDPQQRARATEIVQQMERMIHQFPPTFTNQIEMFRRIGNDETLKQDLREENERLITQVEENREESERVAQLHQAEVQQLHTKMNATQACLQTELQQRQRLLTELKRNRREAGIAAQQYQAGVQQLHTEMNSTQAQLQTEIQQQHRLATELRQSRREAENTAQQHAAQVEQLHTENSATQTQLREEIQRLQKLAQHCQEEIKQSKLVHSIEIQQSCLQLSELQIQSKAQQTELRAKLETCQVEMRAQSEVREQERKTLKNQQDVLTEETARMRREIEELHAVITSKDQDILSKDREIWSKNREIHFKDGEIQSMTAALSATIISLSKKEAENEHLQAALLTKDNEIELKQHALHTKTEELSARNDTIAATNLDISTKEAALVTKDATLAQKESEELASQNTVLDHQSSIIQGLREQLTRPREHVLGQKPQPHPLDPQAKITWESCSDLPVRMSEAQAVVIRGRVYFGGGAADGGDDEYRVFCYSPSEDTWTTLPTCPVQWFGLGQVKGKLVTVGGINKSDGNVTNEVYEFDEEIQHWKQSIPPIPTARWSPAVLSHHYALIVAGGYTGRTRTTAVEVFREETSHWYTTEPLPFRWRDASSVLINSRWYLLGGRAEGVIDCNRVVCAHVDLLLQKALPRDRASTERDSTVWQVLPKTPHYRPAAATFGTYLLAVGGTTTSSTWNADLQATVHVYYPNTNAWIHISDLPAPLVWGATEMLSSTELLVIGGWNTRKLNKVYKGLLQIE